MLYCTAEHHSKDRKFDIKGISHPELSVFAYDNQNVEYAYIQTLSILHENSYIIIP